VFFWSGLEFQRERATSGGTWCTPVISLAAIVASFSFADEGGCSAELESKFMMIEMLTWDWNGDSQRLTRQWVSLHINLIVKSRRVPTKQLASTRAGSNCCFYCPAQTQI
jgi:hypothetical protein